MYKSGSALCFIATKISNFFVYWVLDDNLILLKNRYVLQCGASCT